MLDIHCKINPILEMLRYEKRSVLLIVWFHLYKILEMAKLYSDLGGVMQMFYVMVYRFA